MRGISDNLRNSVSRETSDKLHAYVDLVGKWSPKINLISKATLAEVWTRHIEDSVQVAEMIHSSPQDLADLGSGGGLPGVVISILLPDTRVNLVESDQRKSTFLATCIRELSLNARIKSGRIEGIDPIIADVVTARALAPLPVLLGYVSRHMKPAGYALLPKGRGAAKELAEARKTWSFICSTTISKTNPEAQILRVEEINRV